VTKASPFPELPDRWNEFVNGLAGISNVYAATALTEEGEIHGSDNYLSIAEISIPHAPRDLDSGSDYLVVVLWRTDRDPANLKLLLPSTLRNSSKRAGSGLVISDVSISAVSGALTDFEILLYRINRTPRTERTLTSIQNLVSAQEAVNAIVHSGAFAPALLDRIELLDQSAAAQAIACGKVHSIHPPMSEKGRYWAVVAGSGTAYPRYWVKNWQLHAGETADSAAPLTSETYILLRLGPKLQNVAPRRFIDELRQRHRQREDLDTTGKSETYQSYIEKETKRRLKAEIDGLYGHNKMLPVVTPVAIEAAQDLEAVVRLETKPESEFQKLINDMRQEIKERYGVQIPGLRVRLNDTDMPVGSYLIMISEVPLVMGFLNPENVFCEAGVSQLQQAGIPADAATHPVDGSPCTWVDRTHKATLDAAGFSVLSPGGYIVLHLSSVVRKNLPEFLRLQDVLTMLEAESDSGPGMILRIRSAEGGIVRFRNILAALLEEDLPCKPLLLIAERFLELSGRPAHEISEEIRCLEPIRALLNRDLESCHLYRLAPSFVTAISQNIERQGDAAVLRLEPELTQEALSAVRLELKADSLKSPGRVIVVDDWTIRRFVRKLIELEFPDVIVLARRELADAHVHLVQSASVIDLE
jgi:hypothetical protein